MCDCALLDEGFPSVGCHTASPRKDFDPFRVDALSKMQ